MPKGNEVGYRIAQARRELGVRKGRDVRPVDVARALKVSQATVSDWESGKTAAPRRELLEKLAAYLGVTREYLLFGVRTPLVQLTEAEIADAIARSAARRQAEGLPPIERDEPIDTPDDTDEDDPPARTAAGGRKRPTPRRGGR